VKISILILVMNPMVRRGRMKQDIPVAIAHQISGSRKKRSLLLQ